MVGYFPHNRAYRITGGVIESLGTGGFHNSFAFDINDAGQVVGSLRSATGTSARLARFTDGIGWEILGGVGGANAALAINNHGTVVGSGVPDAGQVTAVVFFDGHGLFDLDDLVPGTEWNLLRAVDINDAGQILARGANTVTGEIRSLVLTPWNELPAGIHVADISISFRAGQRGNLDAIARVTIVDQDGSPVTGVRVEGAWTRADLPFATGQGQTDSTGVAVITKRLKSPAPGTRIGFCVRNVEHQTLPSRVTSTPRPASRCPPSKPSGRTAQVSASCMAFEDHHLRGGRRRRSRRSDFRWEPWLTGG